MHDGTEYIVEKVIGKYGGPIKVFNKLLLRQYGNDDNED